MNSSTLRDLMFTRQGFLALCVLLLAVLASRTATACPFCSGATQTFSEEMASMEVVVIAELVKLAPPPPPGVYSAPEFSRFKVVKFLKGEELMETEFIDTMYVGEGQPGDKFLTMGTEEGNLMWSVPLPANDRVIEYLETLPTLPESGVERLRFFQENLEDADELLARDAYDEFAVTPYEVVQELGPYMDREQLIGWINDDGVPASRRRLYLTMLGVCGLQEDLPMLEAMLHSEETHLKAGLDAMIACYLTLAGREGLPLIEDLFLKTHETETVAACSTLIGTPWETVVGEPLIETRKPEYADTYSAIMALRFHGTDADVLEKEDILHSMRFMLDRPELSDLVIPDLARWEDWSVMDRLFTIYRDAQEDSNWVRVPIVNYFRACPLPEAEKYLEQCELIDPEAVKRANTFFPRSGSATPGDTTDPATSVDAAGNSMIAGYNSAQAREANGPDSTPARETAGTAAQPAPGSDRGNLRLYALALGAVGVVLLILATMKRPATKQEP